MSNARGEDRSSYQAVTGWGHLAFGFAKATEGTSITDSTFADNWKNLKYEGKVRGAYHFLHPGQDAVEQARAFVKVVREAGLEPGDMLAVDSELLSGAVSNADTVRRIEPVTVEDMGLTPDEVDNRTKAFLDEVKRLVGDKHPLIVYTMHEVGQYLVKTAAAYPLLWFAWPSSTPPDAALIAPWKFWKFWQDGVSDNTDQDLYVGTATELDAFIKGYKPKPIVIVHWRVLSRVTLAGAASRHHTTPAAMLEAAVKAGHVYGRWMKRYIARADWNAPLPIGSTLYAEEIA